VNRSLRLQARVRAQAARMNELDRVVRHALAHHSPAEFEHRDNASQVELSYQDERSELRLGFGSDLRSPR
jgi:hypothetical protein